MTEPKINHFQLVKRDCHQTLDNWVGGCQLDCDDCPVGMGGSDICYLLYCFFLNVINDTDMKTRLEQLRARHAKKKRKMPSPKVVEEAYAMCSNRSCLYGETVTLMDDKLVATKKFIQGSDGKVYHICLDGRPSRCELK